MRDGTPRAVGIRHTSSLLRPSLPGRRSWDLALGQVSLPCRLGKETSWGSTPQRLCSPPEVDISPVHSPFYHPGWAPGWKTWYPPDPLVLPPSCHCPGSWVLIPADASGLKTHIRHLVAEHSTKPGEIKSICMNSCEGGEYLTLLFINNSLALTCLNKWSNKVKCRSQRLTNMKIRSLTRSLPSAAGSPNLCG